MATAKVERQNAARHIGSIGKAADDEPIFILRARDILAPGIVERWADELSIVHSAKGTVAPDPMKIKEARALAHQMRAWQAMNGAKLPD